MVKVRMPYNAGSWYAGSREALLRQLEEECFLHPLGPGEIPQAGGGEKILGLMSPHAGYMYSGPIAAHGYAALKRDGRPEVVVVLGPNHYGRGSAVSIMVEGVWRTPLGDVPVNGEVAKAIQQASSYIDVDDEAHAYEHSIELQLPFLQYVLGSFTFIPICIMLQDLEISRDIGEALAEGLKNVDSLIVASSDLTHYEPQTSAERKDKAVLEAVERLDEALLFRTVEELNVSMCGVGPVAAMLVAVKKLGASRVKILKYATSGDVTGDRTAVVGYASAAVYG
ncbi:AmmeMemoRadiSam system protein B [Candidatus Bathyarchaeota archaeon]|nr:MAG: AmmeMemoRadiSam system protein B [Candidatus Hecatellales archaeon]RLI35741.1 MAG: AmmeMemoRadiSam system protein B [Candidatus Bathyarchaeota archaeon]